MLMRMRGCDILVVLGFHSKETPKKKRKKQEEDWSVL